MRILVWQWGRLGAGPRVAVELADALRRAGAASVILSLSDAAEILSLAAPAGSPSVRTARPRCEITVRTYESARGFVFRFLTAPLSRRSLRRRIAAFAPQLAICAMPALLDPVMVDVLGRLDIPFVALIHDADLHPGDGVPLQMRLQRRLMARASALVTLSAHVEERVREQVGPDKILLRTRLPPFVFGATPSPPLAHGGPLRLLFFGRLLPYKGLDLLADALARLDRTRLAVRVVGQGPDAPALRALGALAGVTVENRWVPEGEVGALIAWADALVLPYREASQSGVAAAAISARRWVVATAVGGLVDQFRDEALARICAPEPAAIAAAIASLLDAPPPAAPASNTPISGLPERTADRAAATLLEALGRVFGPFPPVGLASFS